MIGFGLAVLPEAERGEYGIVTSFFWGSIGRRV